MNRKLSGAYSVCGQYGRLSWMTSIYQESLKRNKGAEICVCDSKGIVPISLKGVSHIMGSVGMQALANAK